MKVFGNLERAQIETVSVLPTGAGAIRGRIVRLDTIDGANPVGLYEHDGTVFKLIVDSSTVQTLTNKTIDGASNTLTNVPLGSVTGTVGIGNGGTGQTTANPAFNALSPLTTKGDTIAYSTVNARLGVGSDGQVLTADSAQALGVRWAASGASAATVGNAVIGATANRVLFSNPSALLDDDAALKFTDTTQLLEVTSTNLDGGILSTKSTDSDKTSAAITANRTVTNTLAGSSGNSQDGTYSNLTLAGAENFTGTNSAIHSKIQTSGSAEQTNIVGVRSEVALASTGAVSAIKGISSGISTASDVTNAYGIHIATPTKSAGTVANYVGLQVDSPSSYATSGLAISATGKSFLSLLTTSYTSDSASGASASLTAPTTGKVRMSNAALTSVAMIGAVTGAEITLINDTGASVLLLNETGGTAADQIITGTGASIVMPNDTAVKVVYDAVSTKWRVVGSRAATPTVQKFTSSSGTYTTPAGASYIKVRMVGAGGGGAGSSTTGASDGGNGGTGGNTTFGTTLLVANGGGGGQAAGGSGAGGTGGTASLGTGPIGTALSGGTGQGFSGGATSQRQSGGAGASTPLGGAGGGGASSTAGQAAAANTGSGGGGGGAPTAGFNGPGGGAGGFVEAIITSPSASYSYAVGAVGSAGTAGTSGFAGGAGGLGYIEVTEYYN